MFFFELLDKNKQIQLNILNLLVSSEIGLSEKYIVDELGLSSFLFESNINRMKEFLDGRVEFNSYLKKGINFLEVKNKSQFNMDSIYNYYFRDSVEFKIIDYVYKNRYYTIPKLSLVFNHSEVSIYRIITKMNNFFQSFDIRFKNGEILGDELEICYLYYNFYSGDILNDKEYLVVYDKSFKFMLNLIQQRLGIFFTEESRLKVSIWVRVLNHRKFDKNHRHSFNKQYLRQIWNDPVYLIIREAYIITASHSAGGDVEYKDVYLYLFITSMFIITPNENMSRTNISPEIKSVKQINDKVISLISTRYNRGDNNDINISKLSYVLSQFHSQIFLFKSGIDIFLSGYIPSDMPERFSLKDTDYLPQEITAEVKSIFPRIITIEDEKKLEYIYASVVSRFDFLYSPSVQIGVHATDYLMEEEILIDLDMNLNGKYKVHVEKAKCTDEYDILIIDSMIFSYGFSYQELYICNTKDFNVKTLEKLIRKVMTKEGQ